MKPVIFTAFIALLSQTAVAQLPYKVGYAQLKQYEGEYDYFNQSRLTLAASPKDTILYAIIEEVKYPLKPVEKDVFANNGNDKVVFLRNEKNEITGYKVAGQSFNLRQRIVIDPNFWYARKPQGAGDFKYAYKVPEKRNDGLPVGDLRTAGADMPLIDAMMNKVVNETYPNIHSILVIKDGRLVLEEYFYEYGIDKKHQLRSATKSFFSALTGIAIDKGYIKNTEQAVVSYFPEYDLQNPSPLKSQITLRHLLTNQTGLDCDIDNEKSVGNETVLSHSDDWIKFTLDLPMTDTPGGRGMYCSGNAVTLGRIVEKATAQPLLQFAKENLFDPLGITDYQWHFKPDKSSAETFCQLYLRPRDMAKFGLLYMNGGVWNGRQIVSRDWVRQSHSKQSIVSKSEYGYLWWLQWLNVQGKRYDGIAAKGNGGQRIYLFPEQNMVAIITGGSFNVQSASDKLLVNHILPAFGK